MGEEEWRDIPGWPCYQASRGGQVRSVPRRMPDGRWHGGKLLKQRRDRKGYWTVTMPRDGKRVPKRVHVLVALAWHGERPPGAHILHRGDDKDRNGAGDLRYGTPRRNVLERVKRERRKESYRRNRKTTYRVVSPATPVTPVLTSRQAAALEMWQQGKTQAHIASVVGVHQTTIGSWVRRFVLAPEDAR